MPTTPSPAHGQQHVRAIDETSMLGIFDVSQEMVFLERVLESLSCSKDFLLGSGAKVGDKGTATS